MSNAKEKPNRVPIIAALVGVAGVALGVLLTAYFRLSEESCGRYVDAGGFDFTKAIVAHSSGTMRLQARIHAVRENNGPSELGAQICVGSSDCGPLARGQLNASSNPEVKIEAAHFKSVSKGDTVTVEIKVRAARNLTGGGKELTCTILKSGF